MKRRINNTRPVRAKVPYKNTTTIVISGCLKSISLSISEIRNGTPKPVAAIKGSTLTTFRRFSSEGNFLSTSFFVLLKPKEGSLRPRYNIFHFIFKSLLGYCDCKTQFLY